MENKDILEEYIKVIQDQKDMNKEFKDILYGNLWDLYSEEEEIPPWTEEKKKN